MRFPRIPADPTGPRIRRVIGIHLFLAKRSDGRLLHAMCEARVFEAGMGMMGMRGATDTKPRAMRPDVISTTGHMRPGAMIPAIAAMPSGDSAVRPAAAMISATASAGMAAATSAAMASAATTAMAATASAASTAAATTTATTTTTATCRSGQGDSGSG